MKEYKTWSSMLENQYIDEKTVSVEDSFGNLKLYSYFSTLRWATCYAIVVGDTVVREQEGDYPYEEWDMAVDMAKVLAKEIDVRFEEENDKEAEGRGL